MGRPCRSSIGCRRKYWEPRSVQACAGERVHRSRVPMCSSQSSAGQARAAAARPSALATKSTGTTSSTVSRPSGKSGSRPRPSRQSSDRRRSGFRSSRASGARRLLSMIVGRKMAVGTVPRCARQHHFAERFRVGVGVVPAETPGARHPRVDEPRPRFSPIRIARGRGPRGSPAGIGSSAANSPSAVSR